MLVIKGRSYGEAKLIGLLNDPSQEPINVYGFMFAESWSSEASAPTIISDGGLIRVDPVCSRSPETPADWALQQEEEVSVRERDGFTCVSRQQKVDPRSGWFVIDGLAVTDTVTFMYLKSNRTVRIAATEFGPAQSFYLGR